MSAGYKLIYDVAQDWPPVWFPALGLVLIVAGALQWRRSHGARRAFAGLFLGFGVLWTTMVTATTLGEALAARTTLRSGKAGVVEGPVEDFHPMPYGGHDTERFRIGGVHFKYSDYIVGSSFNHTSSHGGPIREGLLVRIAYGGPPTDARILRLEVRD